MKQLALLCISLLFPCFLLAQNPWYELTSPISNTWWDAAFINRTTGWVSGSDGKMLRTVDGGQNWKLQATGSFKTLYTVCALDAQRVWAAGVNGTLLRSTDGGDSWQATATSTQSSLRDLFFLDENHGWAVGAQGTLLHTKDGGTTWTPQPSGTLTYLLKIQFHDLNLGWAAGDELLRTTDGGHSWERYDPQLDVLLHALDFVDENHGWAAGGGAGSDDGALLKTEDGGKTWRRIQAEVVKKGWWFDLHFTDLQRGWLLGCDASGQGQVLSTYDGGETWRNIELPPGLACFYGADFADLNTGWAVGQDGALLHYLTNCPPLPAPQLSVDETLFLCPESQGQLTATTALPYLIWSDGSTGPSMMVEEAGMYTVIGRDSVGCESPAASPVEVVRMAPQSLLVTAPDSVIPVGGQVLLSASPGFVAYEWSHGAQGASTWVSEPGSYYVWATDSGNCTYRSDSLELMAATPTALATATAASNFACYPNPATTHLTLELPANGPARVVLYDLQGRLIGEV
jgi:photosystem II stability/assembly factor-like uncharacterized protein